MLAGISWVDLRQKYDEKFVYLFRALMAYGAGKKNKAKKIATRHIENSGSLQQFRQDMEAYFTQEKIIITSEFCAWVYRESRHNPSFIVNFNGQRRRKKTSKDSVLPTIFEQDDSTVESPKP